MFTDATGAVKFAGKHLKPSEAGSLNCGEFLGLWRMSKSGTDQFRAAFETLDRKTDPTEPFQHAVEWRRAYITDMVQHLVEQDVRIDTAIISRGWAELDTIQDYERLPIIAERQDMKFLHDTLIAMKRDQA